jgi:hypothetical protein
MPNGWNDTTHAGQRALIAFGGYAAHNLFQEFAPEIGRALNRFHVRKPALLPIWWKRCGSKQRLRMKRVGSACYHGYRYYRE